MILGGKVAETDFVRRVEDWAGEKRTSLYRLPWPSGSFAAGFMAVAGFVFP